MLTVALPDALETALLARANRHGLSIDDYLATICADALSLEIDRERVASFRSGTQGIPNGAVCEWLADLAAGKRSEHPR